MPRVKVIQIWEHKTTKVQIRVLDVANKIVVAETLSNKAPIFLTSIDLEQNYKMTRIEPKHE